MIFLCLYVCLFCLFVCLFVCVRVFEARFPFHLGFQGTQKESHRFCRDKAVPLLDPDVRLFRPKGLEEQDS